MKKVLLIFSYLIISSMFINAQTLYTTTQTSISTQTLWSVFFTDANTGYVVGNNGTIVKTTNGGVTWSSQTSGTNEQLFSVYFINPNIGWAVGSNYTILKTINGGVSWAPQTCGFSDNHFFLVYFIDANTGYIVTQTGSIIKTTDGGNSWVCQINERNPFLFSICFVNSNTGYAVGGTGFDGKIASSMKVLKTTNGGNTWSAITNGVTDGVLTSVKFINNSIGYASGIKNDLHGVVLKTTDGGDSWTEKIIPTAYCLRSVYFIDANNGFCCGDDGLTYKTTDGGNTWVDISDPALKHQGLYSIFFINQNTGWQVGSSGSIIQYTSTTPTITMPTISTSIVNSITANTASCGGNISSDGGATITARGVCWSTSANPTIADNKTTDGTGIGTFTSSITGLTLNTPYYVRAYATNSAGTAYGNEISLMTTTLVITTPTIITSTINSITSNSASSGGNITYDGGASITARGVCWSTSVNPTIADSKTSNGTGTGTFTSSITGLTPNTKYYVRAYATNSAGTAYGNEVSFTTNTAFANCGTVTDIDGNTYNTVTIGTQCWMQENLKTTKYRDGTAIPNVTNSTEWIGLTAGAYCWYNNDAIKYKASYGALYNWYAVVDSRNLCPVGWHVPTDTEWGTLTNYLAKNGYGYGGSGGIGKSLASTSGWNSDGTVGSIGNDQSSNNSSGFTALPGGCMLVGDFGYLGATGFWWSATEGYGSEVWYQSLYYNYSSFFHSSESKRMGFSVRCVKDIDTPPLKYTLTLAVNPVGAGSLSGAGEYEAGKDIPLTAAPAIGYKFVNWTINGVELSTQANYTYKMPNNDVTIVANFEKIGDTFNFVVETTSGQLEYKFMVDNAVNLTVDWGDNATNTYNGSQTLTHNYGKTGLWTIKAKGQASRLSFSTSMTPLTFCPYAPMLKDILNPISTGISGITNADWMFGYTTVKNFTCSNFFDDVSTNVTSMNHMFYRSSFDQNINNWNVHKVKNMGSLFCNTSFNQDISSWDVGETTNMYSMFMGDSKFNQDISHWNVSNVTDMSYMFTYATAFNQKIGLWNVSNVTDMSWMFHGIAFNQDIGNWNVSKVIKMTGMFSYTSFNHDISKWDVSKVTNMQSMLRNSSFNQDISNWNVSNVTDMSSMFEEARAFNQNIGNWDVSNVTKFDGFLKNSSISTINYNKLLINWSKLNLKNNLTFDAGNSKYDVGLPTEKRQVIIDTFHWNIIDAGTTGVLYVK